MRKRALAMAETFSCSVNEGLIERNGKTWWAEYNRHVLHSRRRSWRQGDTLLVSIDGGMYYRMRVNSAMFLLSVLCSLLGSLSVCTYVDTMYRVVLCRYVTTLGGWGLARDRVA